MMLILKKIRNKIQYLLKSESEKRHSLVGQGHLWAMKQKFQFEFLQNKGLQISDKLMDIGCGTLRGGIPLIKYLNEENYFGIDIRDFALDEGKKEIKKYELLNKKPNLLCFKNFNELKFENNFNFMFAYSVLIHMEDKIANDCFKFVSLNLIRSGVFYANVNTISRPEGSWAGFPVVFRSIEFYEKMALNHNLTTSVIGKLSEIGHNSGDELSDNQIMLEFRHL